mgnify:CR=1 FL=1
MLTGTVKNEANNDSRTIDFQAENDLHVQINDFNFDGVKDFAVSQIGRVGHWVSLFFTVMATPPTMTAPANTLSRQKGRLFVRFPWGLQMR